MPEINVIAKVVSPSCLRVDKTWFQNAGIDIREA